MSVITCRRGRDGHDAGEGGVAHKGRGVAHKDLYGVLAAVGDVAVEEVGRRL
jgi:hypothetical protein